MDGFLGYGGNLDTNVMSTVSSRDTASATVTTPKVGAFGTMGPKMKKPKPVLTRMGKFIVWLLSGRIEYGDPSPEAKLIVATAFPGYNLSKNPKKHKNKKSEGKSEGSLL